MAFVLVVNLRIKKDCVPQFMAECLKNAKAARETEPGCRQFDVLSAPDDAAKLAFYEVYDDARAFEAHQQTPHFKHYMANALQYLESRERQVFGRLAP